MPANDVIVVTAYVRGPRLKIRLWRLRRNESVLESSNMIRFAILDPMSKDLDHQLPWQCQIAYHSAH